MREENFRFLAEKSSNAHIIKVDRAAFSRRGLSWRESASQPFAFYLWDQQGRMYCCSEKKELFFFYGKSEKPLSCYYLNESGKITGSEILEYEESRLIRRIRRHFPTLSKRVYTYSYNEAYGITASHSDSQIRLHKRDDHGRLYREYLYENSELQLVTNYQYDAKDRLKSVSVCDSNSIIHRQTQYSHDEQGRLASRIIYNSQDKEISNEQYVYGESEELDWRERVTWIPDGKKENSRRPLEVFYRSIGTSVESFEETLKLSQDILAFKSGLYKGELHNGLPEGNGRFTFADGRYFTGHFHNGIIEGQGKLTWPGNMSITGYFRNGLAEGIGTCVWEDGRHYQGEFKRGLMHGKGIFTWPEGISFHGIFKNGEKTDNGHLEREYPEADSNG